MSVTFGRTDTSVLGRWWWTVDRWTIVALFLLVAVGAILTMAASPAVAERIGAQSFHFVRRQFVFLAPAIVIMLAVSLLSPKQVRRLGHVLRPPREHGVGLTEQEQLRPLDDRLEPRATEPIDRDARSQRIRRRQNAFRQLETPALSRCNRTRIEHLQKTTRHQFPGLAVVAPR